jgi:ATP-dependent Clp protease ATP-binding subunit ClpC
MNDFTPRAQQVLTLASKEAERFNHNYVGTEHLLLGLIKLGEGVAVNVLQRMGLDLERVRMEVEKHVGPRRETKMIGNIPYTPRVKKVLALPFGFPIDILLAVTCRIRPSMSWTKRARGRASTL